MSSRDKEALMPVPAHWIDISAGERRSLRPTGWRRDLHAVAAVLFADREGPPPEERLDWLCERVQEFVDDVGGKGSLAFRLSLFVVSWLAPLWSLSLPKLRSRPFERRVHILERWERSPFGMSLFAVKAFATMHYFEHPDVALETSFDPRSIAAEEE